MTRRSLKRPMRVLFATNHSYPPQRVGGSESSTHDLCLTLSELGHVVAVLSSLLLWPLIAAPHRLRFTWRGRGSVVRDETLGYPVFRARYPTIAVRKLIRDVVPDVAVIHAGSLGLVEHFTASGVPCVIYVRDANFGGHGPVLERPDVRYVANSRDIAHRFAAAFGIVPVCIPPLVRRERYEVEPARKNVTFVCPVPQKGLEVSLGLAACRPDIPFVFVESWPVSAEYRRSLERRIRGTQNVTLRRWTLDMRDIYRSAKLMLVPSAWIEGWGRVVSEAQVSGIPALASNHGGLPESVGEGGILVDGNADLSRWEAALARMWDDHAEYGRLAKLALQHSRRPDFQPSTIAARLLDVLSDLVLSHHHR